MKTVGISSDSKSEQKFGQFYPLTRELNCDSPKTLLTYCIFCRHS